MISFAMSRSVALPNDALSGLLLKYDVIARCPVRRCVVGRLKSCPRLTWRPPSRTHTGAWSVGLWAPFSHTTAVYRPDYRAPPCRRWTLEASNQSPGGA